MLREQRDVMWGRWDGSASVPEASTLSVHLPTGRTKVERRGLQTEFPSIDPRLVGRRHRYVVSLAQLSGERASHPLFNGLVRQDVESGRTQSFGFPSDVIPEEHLVVPKDIADATAGEWIIGTALDIEHASSQLSIFDAAHLEDGPVATVRLPYATPLGLHGRFVPA